MILRYIFFAGLFLFPAISLGNNSRYSVQSAAVESLDSSCIERCHVNYMKYRNIYRGEIFRHRTHSPQKKLDCSQCHNNDSVNTKTHGDLVIKKVDCIICHHRNKKDVDCLRCHAGVKEYMEGDIQGIIAGIRDWMSGAVLCTDCHVFDPDKDSFKDVEARCIKCHNPDYGLLYNAWKDILDAEISHVMESAGYSQGVRVYLGLVQAYGMHNVRLSQRLLDLIYGISNLHAGKVH